ncbi:8-oxo-dGTP diphosphatase [Kribbella sp. NPDC051620]|uniref:8-oxo-dGTP diphosphatase n=1 Tax=Kribbella sp. NPDC051620 TaxID=3364120 RepID=UPI0037A8C34D
MSVTEMCLCFLVARDPDGAVTHVLLGRKKDGFGAGNIVGLGGHVDPGETPRIAAVREVAEEAYVTVAESDLTERATIVFRFPARPKWDQRVTVFIGESWQGEPKESDEIAPEWHPAEALPLDLMWDDASYWLQRVLTDEHLDADIVFNDDNRTVRQASLTPRNLSPQSIEN